MLKAMRVLITVVIVTALCVASEVDAQAPQRWRSSASAANGRVEGDPSVLFVENVGQFAEGARFQVWGGEYTMWLAEDAIWITVLERPGPQAGAQLQGMGAERPPFAHSRTEEVQPLRGVNLRLSFPGANPHPRLEPSNRLDTHVSYFIGNDPDKWHPDVPVWGGVRYVDLYPGIDLQISGEGRQIVQRVVAQPGADVSVVRLRVEGAEQVAVDGRRLRLSTAVGPLALPLLTVEGAPPSAAPSAFHPVPGTCELQSPFASASPARDRAGQASGASDLVYATFLGGFAYDRGYAIAVDASGAAYVAGRTQSSDFPTTPAAFDMTYNGGDYDAFVAKLNAAGSGLAYATFLGGSDYDFGFAIAVDLSGAAYVAGGTESSDFPTTPAAFDTAYNGGSWGDAFVAKLDPAGSGLAYATFLGGADRDGGHAIAVDPSGAAYVAGYTASSDFPTTPAAFDGTFGGGWCLRFPCADAFAAKLNPAGSGLAYATFLGGSHSDSGFAIAVDASGAAYVAGLTESSVFPTTPAAFDTTFNGNRDAFVAKLDPAGSGLAYATFLGGTDKDWGFAIAVGASGVAYVAGYTASSDFPTTPAAFDTTYNGGDHDAYVTKLDPAGSGLAYATFLGGSYADWGYGMAVDASGAAYVAGYTYSSDFPTTPAAFDTTLDVNYDAYVARLNPAGSGLAYATFLGGSKDDYGRAIAVDASGAAYVAGYTGSSDFPTTPAAFDTTHNGGYYEAFVAKLIPNQLPALGAITPSGGSGPAGVTRYFNTTWHDPDGWENLKHCYFHIGASSSLAGNVTLLYDVRNNKLWMRSDDGSSWLGGYAPWSDNTIENRQAKVYCLLTRDERSGDTLSVRWAIKFKADFRGVKKTGLKCTDLYNAKAKGAWMGTWNIY
jgi:hypothetical protein